MNPDRSSIRSGSAAANQLGATLIVVLVLLLVMTAVAVVVLRSTIVGERMSANTFDRSLAFQSAESALREAELAIRTVGSSIVYDCDASGVVCPSVPSNVYASSANCTAGTFKCWIDADADIRSGSDLSAGTPQYYVEYLGQRTSEDELGLSGSANQAQYGGGGGVPMSRYYRVTARSNNPVDGRAIVVLQTTVVER